MKIIILLMISISFRCLAGSDLNVYGYAYIGNLYLSDLNKRVSKSKVELILTKKIKNDWRFFSELEFKKETAMINDGTSSKHISQLKNNTIIERVWFKKRISKKTYIKTGSFFNPFGAIASDHFPTVRDSPSKFFNYVGDDLLNKMNGFSLNSSISNKVYNQVYIGSERGKSVLGNRLNMRLGAANLGFSMQAFEEGSLILGLDFKSKIDNFLFKISTYEKKHKLNTIIETSYVLTERLHPYVDLEFNNSRNVNFESIGLDCLVSGNQRIKIGYNIHHFKDNSFNYNSVVLEFSFGF